MASGRRIEYAKVWKKSIGWTCIAVDFGAILGQTHSITVRHSVRKFRISKKELKCHINFQTVQKNSRFHQTIKQSNQFLKLVQDFRKNKGKIYIRQTYTRYTNMDSAWWICVNNTHNRFIEYQRRCCRTHWTYIQVYDNQYLFLDKVSIP